MKDQGIAQAVVHVEASGFTLMVLGAAATIAALAGQLNLAGVAEFPLMKSGILRTALFVVGAFFFLIGLGLVSDVTATTPSDAGSEREGGSSPEQRGNGPATPTEMEPPGDDFYAGAGEAACTAAARRAQPLPDIPENASDEQLVQYTLAWTDNVALLWDSLAQVSPTGGVPDDHQTLLFKLDLYHDNLEDAAYGLRAGDGTTFDNNINRVESLAVDYNRVAKALELPSCQLSVG